MGKLLFHLWARTMCLTALYCGLMASIALWYWRDGTIVSEALSNPPAGSAFAIYIYVMTVLFFPFMWPLEFLGRIRIIMSNYWVNGVIMIVASIFLWLSLGTMLAALCFDLAGVFFIIAAIRGEPTDTLESLAGGAKPAE